MENMEFHLYLEELSEQAVAQFVRAFEQQHNDITIEINKVDKEDIFFTREGNVIVSELCEIPYWQLMFLTPLESIAYEAYHLCLNNGWNACLFAPKSTTVSVGFEEGLLAIKVAHLWYREGKSDKVYHLYLAYEPNANFYTIISRYGRRNGVLRQQEKSFDTRLEEAEKEWKRIFDEKKRKGYQEQKTIRATQLEFEF